MDSRWEKTITLKTNDKKGNDRAPDYRGSFTLNGVEYNLALWPAKSGNGWSGKIEERKNDSVATHEPDEDSEAPPF